MLAKACSTCRLAGIKLICHSCRAATQVTHPKRREGRVLCHRTGRRVGQELPHPPPTLHQPRPCPSPWSEPNTSGGRLGSSSGRTSSAATRRGRLRLLLRRVAVPTRPVPTAAAAAPTQTGPRAAPLTPAANIATPRSAATSASNPRASATAPAAADTVEPSPAAAADTVEPSNASALAVGDLVSGASGPAGVHAWACKPSTAPPSSLSHSRWLHSTTADLTRALAASSWFRPSAFAPPPSPPHSFCWWHCVYCRRRCPVQLPAGCPAPAVRSYSVP